MKLYYFAGACSLADHIVLEWIGRPYEAQRTTHALTKSPEYLALNPNGAVPVLTDGDFVLTQNAAVLFYLADRNPFAGLLGDGSPRQRADILRWLCFLNSDVHPAFKPIFRPAAFHPDESMASVIKDTARQNIRRYLDVLERQLDGRDWLVDRRSIADPYLFVLLRWAVRFQVDTLGLTHLAAFLARMYADPGVRAALIAEEDSIDVETRMLT
jgi:glutathione S-transferase